MPLIKAFLDEDEDLELLWLAGLARGAEGSWQVRPVTRGIETKRIKAWRLPIGLLPLLAPGQCFSGGDRTTTAIRGEIACFHIDNVGDCEEVTSDAVPPALLSVEGHKLGVQRLFRYQVDGGDLLVPTIELARYLFLHNKTMANALMHAGGIMELFRPEHPGQYDHLHLHFTEKMPVSLLSKKFVAAFAWIAIHPDGRRSWDSVSALSTGQRYVSFVPPPLLNSDWTVRSITWQTTTLVLEIRLATGKCHPCNILRYSHPSLREAVAFRAKEIPLNGVSQSEDPPRPREIRHYVVDDEVSGSRIDTRQSVLQGPSMLATYDRAIEIMKVAAIGSPGSGRNTDGAAEPRARRGSDIPIHRRVRVPASVAEEETGATLQPIEFDLLEPAEPGYLGELEPLIRVLGVMANMLPTLGIASSLCSLKAGRAFSMAGHHRRACLIAIFRPPNRPPLVLIDVDHSGQCALSSLVLTYRQPCTFREMEEHMDALLGGVVNGSGHWDTAIAKGFACSFDCARLPKVLRQHGQLGSKVYQTAWAVRLIELLGFEDLWNGER